MHLKISWLNMYILFALLYIFVVIVTQSRSWYFYLRLSDSTMKNLFFHKFSNLLFLYRLHLPHSKHKEVSAWHNRYSDIIYFGNWKKLVIVYFGTSQNQTIEGFSAAVIRTKNSTDKRRYTWRAYSTKWYRLSSLTTTNKHNV